MMHCIRTALSAVIRQNRYTTVPIQRIFNNQLTFGQQRCYLSQIDDTGKVSIQTKNINLQKKRA